MNTIYRVTKGKSTLTRLCLALVFALFLLRALITTGVMLGSHGDAHDLSLYICTGQGIPDNVPDARLNRFNTKASPKTDRPTIEKSKTPAPSQVADDGGMCLFSASFVAALPALLFTLPLLLATLLLWIRTYRISTLLAHERQHAQSLPRAPPTR